MNKVLFVIAVMTVIILSPFQQVQAENYKLSPADYLNLADQQQLIDRDWPKLVMARQECEANCKSNKCSCLDGLKAKELEIIKVMVVHENLWDFIKADPRPLILHYYWTPKDLRGRQDLKELLVALPESVSIKKRELSLSFFSYGDVEANLASVVQELYAEKKLSDVQTFLKNIGIITIRMPKEFEDSASPNFYLVRDDPNQRGKVQEWIFGSLVFDDKNFGSLENKKFPWTPASIDLMVALAKSRVYDM